MLTPEELLALAEICESIPGPNTDVDGRIARSIKRRPDPRPFTPNYTSNLNDARNITDWLLLYASDIHADGLAIAEFGCISPTYAVMGITGQLPLAIATAALRAQAIDAGWRLLSGAKPPWWLKHWPGQEEQSNPDSL